MIVYQEFCRNLGESVTFETTGLGDGVSEDLLDFEKSLQQDKKNKDKSRSEKWLRWGFCQGS